MIQEFEETLAQKREEMAYLNTECRDLSTITPITYILHTIRARYQFTLYSNSSLQQGMIIDPNMNSF